MVEMHTVKLHYRVADELSAYLDRAHISYTLEQVTENPYYYNIHFDEGPDKIVYRTVMCWLDMRRNGLKYCPFCGGIAELLRYREFAGKDSYQVARVRCIKCGFGTKHVITDGYYGAETTEQDVIDVWNRRFMED